MGRSDPHRSPVSSLLTILDSSWLGSAWMLKSQRLSCSTVTKQWLSMCCFQLACCFSNGFTTKTWLVIWLKYSIAIIFFTVLQSYSRPKNGCQHRKHGPWPWPGLSFFLSANSYSRTSIQVFDPMEAPAMRSRKSEIVARLRIAACEKLCLSCWFPALTSFVDEKLGYLVVCFCLNS